MQGFPAPVPFVGSVLHASDFSPASERAFAHALAVALLRKTELTILNAHEDDGVDWRQFPAVRDTLQRWGLLEVGSPRSAVWEQLAVRVSKVSVRGRDPADALVGFVRDHPADLLVLATEGREGLPRWLHPSVAADVFRRTRTATLFVPEAARGFVSLEDGSTRLRRIVVPVDERPDPAPAVVYATRAAEALGDLPVAVTLLHVGPNGGMPAMDLPEDPAWTFQREERSGDPAEVILGTARSADADLLVLATEGRQGIFDALRGSVTERVLRSSPCPLLAVPAA